jgi:DNA-directed RNA polymerase subunit RPC12/RpoP
MEHTCDTCGSAFESKLKRDLHADTCGDDQLFCQECGERFGANRATQDGWHYRCPNEGCDGQGIGEDLLQVEKTRVMASQ